MRELQSYKEKEQHQDHRLRTDSRTEANVLQFSDKLIQFRHFELVILEN